MTITPAQNLLLTAGEEAGLTSVYNLISTNATPLSFDEEIWQEEYTYDAAGNRSMKKTGWGEIGYTYNLLNRLTTAGNKGYVYDVNGNMVHEDLNGKSAEYTYSLDNRLVNIYSEIPGINDLPQWNGKKGAAYEYDVFGRKTSRIEYTRDENGAIEWLYDTNQAYLYDGMSFRVLGEFFDLDYQKKITGVSTGLTAPYKEASTVPVRGNVTARRDILSRSTFEDMKDGRNLYVYCGNNPINFIDPTGLEVQILISGTETGTGSLRVDNKLVQVLTYQVTVTDDETGITSTYEVTRHSALDASGNWASKPEDMVTYEPAGNSGTYTGVRSSRAYGDVIELRNSNNNDLRGDLYRSDNGEANDELILIHVGGNYDHPTRGNVNVTSFGCFTLNGADADMAGLDAFIADIDNRVLQQQQGSEEIVITVEKTCGN